MSIKFAIRNTSDKSRKEGDSFVRFSGTGEPFHRNSERAAVVIESDAKGDPTRWAFATGLDPDKVEYYDWLTDEEKELLKDQIKELRPKIVKFYGGENNIKADNWTFWRKRGEVYKLKVTHENIDFSYSTDKPEHALLYLSIMAGAFADTVAPNKDWAERFQLPHYLALEFDLNNFGDEDDITKAEALAELMNIKKEFGKDALYILAWCLQYDTNAFGAYNYSTSEKDLINYNIKYIEGKLVTKRKKNMPKTFMDYAAKWRAPQTRPLLYIEAYVKAGEYFNFISQREKKYVTSDGTVLGNTIADAVKALNSVKYKIDLTNLRDAVEAKWKE